MIIVPIIVVYMFVKKPSLEKIESEEMIVQLNADVLELIFSYLDFRSLCGKFYSIP